MSQPGAPSRIPQTPDDWKAYEAALAAAQSGKDPFAMARWDRPGCKYLHLVDDRNTFWLSGQWWQSLVIAIPPDAPMFNQIPDEQTIAFRDHVVYSHKPTHGSTRADTTA